METFCTECGTQGPSVFKGPDAYCEACAKALGIELVPCLATRAAVTIWTQCWKYVGGNVIELPHFDEPQTEIVEGGTILKKWVVVDPSRKQTLAFLFAQIEPPPEALREVMRQAIIRWKDEPWMDGQEIDSL